MAQRTSGPGYREVAEALRTKIRGGEIGPGERLPALPDLQEKYKASAGVVRDALKQLAHERLIETRHGIGSTVRRPEDWTTTEAAELMQLVTGLRDELREIRDRVDSIERRLS